MGIGGALIMPSTLSILTNVFPAEERGRAIGIWAGVSGLGIAIGPDRRRLAPGALLVGLGLPGERPVVIVGADRRTVHRAGLEGPASPSALDPVGAVLSIVGLVTPRLRHHRGARPRAGPRPRRSLTLRVRASLVLAAFAVWELRSDHPMLDVTFFENPRFTAANVSIVLVFFALFGSLFFLTQYLQFVLGYYGARGRASGSRRWRWC